MSLASWLHLDYDYQKHGNPSWRRIAEVVSWLGKIDLFQDIVKNHTGKYNYENAKIEILLLFLFPTSYISFQQPNLTQAQDTTTASYHAVFYFTAYNRVIIIMYYYNIECIQHSPGFLSKIFI